MPFALIYKTAMKKPIIFSLFAIILFSITIFGQVPPPPPLPVEDDGEVIKFDSRLVVIPVSVTDTNGQPVTGLAAKDFRVFEDRKIQKVEQVSAADKVPLEIAILFDVSASTDAMFQFQQKTAAKFLKDVMRPADRATIYTVGARPVLLRGSDTADHTGVVIQAIVPTTQQTAFYDSVSTAANYLQKNTPPGRRKVIVVISDGEDTNSKGIVEAMWNAERSVMSGKMSLEKLKTVRVKAIDEAKIEEQNKVLKNLQNADTVFYSINPAGSSYQLNKISQFGQSNMQRFADETGGTAFLPKFQPIDTKDQLQNTGNMRKNAEVLEKIFNQLANELQAQYLVQYYSETDFPDNKYVNLDVSLQNPANLRLHARQGYFVKK